MFGAALLLEGILNLEADLNPHSLVEEKSCKGIVEPFRCWTLVKLRSLRKVLVGGEVRQPSKLAKWNYNL